MEEGKTGKERLGGLWLRTSKKGTKFFSGTINGERVVIFKAREKRNEKSPDYEVFRSEPPVARTAQASSAQASDTGITDADIPF